MACLEKGALQFAKESKDLGWTVIFFFSKSLPSISLLLQTCPSISLLLQYLVRPSPTWHDYVSSEALLASFALHGSLLPGWIGVELKLQVLGLVAGMIPYLKQGFWLMSLKRACRSRSRTPPELIRVQCESSYDGETGSCSGSSQSSESGSSTSSSSESSSSPTESHSQTAYDAAERGLILVSYGAGGVPVLHAFTKPKSVACSVHSKLGVASQDSTAKGTNWDFFLAEVDCLWLGESDGIFRRWPVLSMFDLT